MFKPIARIVARGGNICGLLLPLENCELDGIYEIRDVMGELTIIRVGDPAMPESRFTALGLEELLNERPYCSMTQDEIDSVTVDPNGHLWHPILGNR